MSAPDINIDITRQCEDWPDVDDLIYTTIQKLFDICPPESDRPELSIVLADDDFIQDLNKNWRKKDKPTNILSFPQDRPDLLGDLILALETIQQEAREQSKSFEDHATHLIVHGLLHLLGYDHKTPEEAEEMETLEIRILGEFGIKNPYANVNSMP